MARKFRSLFLAAVLLLSFAVPSGNAYAGGYAGVVYGPKATAVVNPEYGVIVNAGSSFDAALYAIGYNPDSSDFTSDVKAYLSNSDTGGAFYTFAQKFTNHNDKWGDGGFAGSDGTNVGVSDFDLNMTTSLKMFKRMYGPSNVWCGQYSAAERVSAVASVGLVLAGDIGGGGSGGGNESPEGYITFSGNISLFNYASSRYSYLQDSNGLYYNNRVLSRWDAEESKYVQYEGDGSSASNAKLLPCPLTVHVSEDLFTNVSSDEIENLYLCVEITNSGYCKGSIYILDDVTYGTNDEQFGAGTQYINGGTKVKASGEIQFNSSGTGYTYSFDGSELYLDKNSGRWPFGFGSSSGSIYYSRGSTFYLPYGTGEIVVPVPPTNWPDTPTNPTPDPPEVDPPTTPDPPNVPVSPTPPTYPPEVTYPDVTYVEADLSAVLDALNEHCEHLQHAIYTASSNLYSSFSSAISGEFTSLKTFMRALASWNVDAINDNFDALYTYLDDFTSWLDAKLRFDDVILLLQAIYNGLPDSVDMTNTNALLQDIYNGMAELDTSSNDLVDLTMLESGVNDISADVELIIQALNNLQDDSQLPTIRGYLKQIYDELDSLNLTLGAIVIPAGSDYTTVLQNIYDEISEYTNTFVQFWDDLRSYLDDILDALDNLEITPRVRYVPTNPPEIPDAPDLDADLNVDALRDALSRLMQKFPFSTINNFVLILTLLTRPAQAPVFDLPLPNPSDWSSPYMVNVDLSIWDVPAAVLRTGIVIWAIARVSRRTVSMWTREEGGGQ